MPEIIEKSPREQCLDALAATDGIELERSANLTHPDQFELITESYYYRFLNSKVVPGVAELYLRLTLSYQARFRNDFTEIGKAPNYQSFSNGPETWE